MPIRRQEEIRKDFQEEKETEEINLGLGGTSEDKKRKQKVQDGREVKCRLT